MRDYFFESLIFVALIFWLGAVIAIAKSPPFEGVEEDQNQSQSETETEDRK